MLMCPYCGWQYDPRGDEFRSALVPQHFDPETGGHCPGSNQHPRNPESDLRTLWNGQPPPTRKVV